MCVRASLSLQLLHHFQRFMSTRKPAGASDPPWNQGASLDALPRFIVTDQDMAEMNGLSRSLNGIM